jgi:hypothetical protein
MTNSMTMIFWIDYFWTKKVNVGYSSRKYVLQLLFNNIQGYNENNCSLLFIDIIFMHQIVQSCKAFKPPTYPKHEKASNVRLDLPRNTHIPHTNKIQREENSSMRGQEDSPVSKCPPSIAPTHTDVPS